MKPGSEATVETCYIEGIGNPPPFSQSPYACKYNKSGRPCQINIRSHFFRPWYFRKNADELKKDRQMFGRSPSWLYICKQKAVPVRLGFSSITTYTENACPADGVPICVVSCVGSDYKGRKGAQILFYSEYHHIIGTAFFVSVHISCFSLQGAMRSTLLALSLQGDLAMIFFIHESWGLFECGWGPRTKLIYRTTFKNCVDNAIYHTI